MYVVHKQDLTYDEAYEVMNEIMSGQTSPTQNAAFLAALSTKSTKVETIDEISGCATAMRDHATPVEHPGLEVLDIVGAVGFGIATPQQAAALLRVLNMAKVRHMSAIIGLTEEEGAEAFFSALETGLSPEEQKKDKSTMPGMSESPFDKVYLVTPAGVEEQLTQRLTEKAKYHFDAQLCTSLDEAVQLAHANTRRGLLVCGSEAAALEAAELLAKA